MSSQNSKWHSLGDFLAAKEARKENEEIASVPETPPISETPSVLEPAPVLQTAPLRTPAAVSYTGEPLLATPPVLQTAPIHKTAPVPEKGGHTRVTHQVSDEILPTLDVFAQSILQRLLRLSWGWNSNSCKVGMVRLANTCNISESKARRAIQLLVARGFIEVAEQDFSNLNQAERGTVYRILLAPAPRTAQVRSTPPVQSVAPIRDTPNKVNTQKENTQTQEGPAANEKPSVRVGSKFTIEECRKYAQHLQATGQGINNPGGYATTIHRTGEADLLIENFLNPTTPTQPLDISQCPDCQGSGFYYPKGINGGVTRCKHENLQGKPNSDV